MSVHGADIATTRVHHQYILEWPEGVIVSPSGIVSFAPTQWNAMPAECARHDRDWTDEDCLNYVNLDMVLCLKTAPQVTAGVG